MDEITEAMRLEADYIEEDTADLFEQFFHDDELFYPTNHALISRGFQLYDIKRVAYGVDPIINGDGFLAQQLWENLPGLLDEDLTVDELRERAQLKAIELVQQKGNDQG